MLETLDFISLVPWTFVAMIANVYILYRLVRRFLFKPVGEILEKRQQAVDAIYAEANTVQADALQIKSQYEQKLSNADSEAKAVITSATEAARKQESEIITDAKARAEHIIEKAETDATQLHRKAAVSLKNDISKMAIDIACKVTQKEINEADHQRLVEDAIRKFEEGAV